MTKLHSACSITLLLAAMASAGAAPLAVSNGAYAGTYVRDCRTGAERSAGTLTPSLCNDATGTFGNTLVDMRYDANYGGLTAATVTLSPLAVGTRGSVDGTGTPGSLILHQATMTNTSYTRASSQVEAMQSFTWDGSGSAHRAIAGHLDFNATNLTDRQGFWDALTTPASQVQASLGVFSLSTGSFEVDTANQNRPAFEDTASTLADYQSEAGSFFESVGPAGLDWNLEFDLVTGRTYYMDAWFGLWAKYGAGIDATHTFTATLGEIDANGQFQQSIAGLRLAPESDDGIHDGNTVPEPSGMALLLLAFGCAGLALRRQRRV